MSLFQYHIIFFQWHITPFFQSHMTSFLQSHFTLFFSLTLLPHSFRKLWPHSFSELFPNYFNDILLHSYMDFLPHSKIDVLLNSHSEIWHYSYIDNITSFSKILNWQSKIFCWNSLDFLALFLLKLIVVLNSALNTHFFHSKHC